MALQPLQGVQPSIFFIFLFPPVPGHHHSAVVHWSRWRALVILLLSTLCMSACADLATEHISPILTNSTISQVSVGMVASLVRVALRIADGSSSPGTCHEPQNPYEIRGENAEMLHVLGRCGCTGFGYY